MHHSNVKYPSGLQEAIHETSLQVWRCAPQTTWSAVQWLWYLCTRAELSEPDVPKPCSVPVIIQFKKLARFTKLSIHKVSLSLPSTFAIISMAIIAQEHLLYELIFSMNSFMNVAAVSMWSALAFLDCVNRGRYFYYKTVSLTSFCSWIIETNQDNIFGMPAFHCWIYFYRK